MRSILTATLTAVAVVLPLHAADKEPTEVTGPLDFTVKDIQGQEAKLSDYKGKVVLMVNVASRCGYTKQYAGLESLYRKYKDDGLVVLGVPSNDFGAQEPGSDEQILEFCKSRYDVSFPMLSKVKVKGDGKTPLYNFLTSKDSNPDFAGEIGWNFEKFLVGRDGKVVGRYKSSVAPESEELVSDIEAALKK